MGEGVRLDTAERPINWRHLEVDTEPVGVLWLRVPGNHLAILGKVAAEQRAGIAVHVPSRVNKLGSWELVPPDTRDILGVQGTFTPLGYGEARADQSEWDQQELSSDEGDGK